MEKLNIEFGFSLQERTSEMPFEDAFKVTLLEYLMRIERHKCTNDTIVFIDGSGCRLEGHNIVLL